MKNTKCSLAAVKSAIVSVVFITLLTVVADLYAPIKDLLKAAFTHHWVGKGILSVVLFFASLLVFYPLSKSDRETELSRLIRALAFTAYAGTFVLIAFFLLEAFK